MAKKNEAIEVQEKNTSVEVNPTDLFVNTLWDLFFSMYSSLLELYIPSFSTRDSIE